MEKKFNDIKNKLLKKVKQQKKLLKSAKKNLKSKRNITIIALVAVLIILAVGFNLNRFFLREVAANVNGNEITVNEMEEQYDFFFFLTGYPESYKQVIDMNTFLNQMINEELLLQEAAKNRISVLDKEVEEELSEIVSRSLISKDEFEIQLNQAGFSMKTLFDYYKKQMIIKKLLDDEFVNISVSDADAKLYYDANKAAYSAEEGQIRLSHILVETEEEAEAILEELKKGKDFVELAKEKSIGPSSVSGGNLGFVSRGQMVSEFEEAAFALNVNQLSDVVQTQFGYHIIKRGSNSLYFGEAKETIIELLKTEQQKELLGAYLDGIKEDSEIVVKLGEEKVTAAAVSGDECYSEYGLESNTVIFYHADWCGYCKTMKPIVEMLSDEGYSFHSAETSNKVGTDVVDACFKDVIQGGVPQFICAGSKEFKMGAMDKSVLKKFADECQ
ncbi:MAG: peptidylprolyl isomerase [Candidatus Woesearchaeota archaeon]